MTAVKCVGLNVVVDQNSQIVNLDQVVAQEPLATEPS